jgi:hypothetical protein
MTTAFAIPDVDPPPPPPAQAEVPKPAPSPEPNDGLRVEGQDASEQALAIVAIADDATEVRVGHLVDVLQELDAKIESDHRPGIKSAHDHHKLLIARMDKWREPVQRALRHLRPLLARRLSEKQRAEEQRQREERERAQAAERDRLLQEAVHAEKTGETKAVVQQILEEAETVAPPPVAARPITALKGVSTRDNWKAEITDLQALVRFVADNPNWIGLIEPNTKALNDQARHLNVRLAATIPGVRAVNDVGLTKRRT